MKKILCLLVMFLFCSAANASIIMLKDGSAVRGNIAHQTETTVFVVEGDSWREIATSEIASIQESQSSRRASVASNLFEHSGTAAQNIKMRELIFKAGYDLEDGTFDNGFYKYGTGAGLSAAVEYVAYVNEYLGFGGGLSAQMPRFVEKVPGRFGFAPVYGMLKLRSLPQEPYYYGYAVGHIGYNAFYADNSFVNDKMSGGFYYAGGFGIVLKQFLFEFLYSVNSGGIQYRGFPDTDITYSKFTISAGIIL